MKVTKILLEMFSQVNMAHTVVLPVEVALLAHCLVLKVTSIEVRMQLKDGTIFVEIWV